MPQIFKIPMAKEYLDEFEDAFVGQEKSPHKFIFEIISSLCRDAKTCKLTKSTPVNRLVDGQKVLENVKFKDINLDDYALPSNPDWIPKTLDVENMGSFDLKLRDKTVEYLKLYGMIFLIRFTEFNKSVDRYQQTILDNLINTGSPEDVIKVQEEQNKKSKADRDSTVPTCIEETVCIRVFESVQKLVSNNINQEFMTEFDEEYSEEEKKRAEELKKKDTKPVQKLPGER